MARIVGDSGGISSINLIDGEENTSTEIPHALRDCVQQLQEYFYEDRKSFNLKLNLQGTPFQIDVWKALQQIPYGSTTSYQALSEQLGDVKAIRAVAGTIAKNKFLVVVPCHRVIGSDGALTGYSAGIWRKRWLLEHENPPEQQSLF
ncbi:MAG: cysteine methyltransferase [Flavobacteriales bacterium]|nr:MAG: cysteine methyltransferase [Flavobacteriales bacterium]